MNDDDDEEEEEGTSYRARFEGRKRLVLLVVVENF